MKRKFIGVKYNNKMEFFYTYLQYYRIVYTTNNIIVLLPKYRFNLVFHTRQYIHI